ncbi:LytTR family DNA-binding domain-containing protein [Cupriavidus sp.]|uniref:LytR/AlgR family response regulator transcription factor n=1 Tax=Cupriavidus sp. TaxID=1873897 RepID=UPI0031D5D12E
MARLAPAVAFLDIKMPGLSGLEVAQGIETDTRLVFVTAYDEFALDAFERAAVDYLVKPVTDERLGRTIERLRKALQESAPLPELAQLLGQLARGQARAEGAGPLRWVRASRGNTTSHVPIQDVLYFQSDDKYVVVHTPDGEHLIRTPLQELIDGLDPEVFWQVHRSTIVNMEHVAGTRRDDSGRLFVRMRGGDTELPVSRAYVHKFRQM